MNPITKYELASDYKKYNYSSMANNMRMELSSDGSTLTPILDNNYNIFIFYISSNNILNMSYSSGLLFGMCNIIIHNRNNNGTDNYTEYEFSSYTEQNPLYSFDFITPTNMIALYITQRRYDASEEQPFILDSYLWRKDITEDIVSWGNIRLISQRNGLTGVITDVSEDAIEIGPNKRFYTDESAYDIIKNIYEQNDIHSKATLNIYVRDDIKTNSYTLEKTINLDFSKYEQSRDMISIEGSSPTLQEYINSQGGTKFDIPVSSIQETKKFSYSNLLIDSNAKYEMPIGTHIERTETRQEYYLVFPLMIDMSEIETIKDRPYILAQRQTSQRFNVKSEAYKGQEFFCENVSNEAFTVHLNFDFYPSIEIFDTMGVTPDGFTAYFCISKYDIDGNNIGDIYIKELKKPSPQPGLNRFVAYDTHVIGSINTVLSPSERLSAYFYTIFNLNGTGGTARFLLGIKSRTYNNYPYPDFKGFNYFNIEWQQRSGEDLMFGVIKPINLAQELLNRFELNRFNAVINWRDIGYLPLLCAGESIRKYPKPYLHTSLNDFIDWLRTKGYEYTIQDDTLIFETRDNLFPKQVTEFLSLDEVNNFKIVSDPEFAYTSIEIGYAKQNYPETNTSGKNELNGTHEYKTTYISADENKLSLISPYRADHYGIEFLSWEIWAEENTQKGNSKERKEDNDIFELASQEFTSNFAFYDRVYCRVGDDKVYNIILNPYFLALRNKSLFGIITDRILFTSTTNNRDLSITELVYDDIPQAWIEQTFNPRSSIFNLDNNGDRMQLFQPKRYMIDVGTHRKLFTNSQSKNGLVEFKIKGDLGIETYRGFIYEMSKNYTKEQAQEWILYAVKN